MLGVGLQGLMLPAGSTALALQTQRGFPAWKGEQDVAAKQLPWQEGRDAPPEPEAPRQRGSFYFGQGTSQVLTCKNCRWLGAIWLSHIITDVSRGVTRRTEAFHTQRSHLGRRQNTKAEAAIAWLGKNCYS